MPSGTFLGLNTALQGLLTTKAAIDTASHNIDNANTPGYSRERVDMTASPSLTEWGLSSQGPGEIGTGVKVADITRLHSRFLDSQYRDQNQFLGTAQVHQTTLNQITGIINEPSNTGISNALQKFWNAWDTLQANPSDLSARTEVKQTGVTLAQTLNQTANQLSNLHTNVQKNLSSRVTQVNSMISQVASLTSEIQKQQQMPGVNPNDLLDKRSYLLDQLSQLGSVSVTDTTNSYQVKLGGTVVVSNGKAATLQALSSGSVQATTYNSSTDTFASASSSSYTTIQSPGGALQGTIDSLSYVQSYQNDINNIAQSLAGVQPATAGGTGEGKMNVTLSGSWSLTSKSGTPTFPVSGTFADGTKFTKGDPVNLPKYANEVSTSSSGGYTIATVQPGATVTVYGINGLQRIGYSQDGPGQDFFVPSGSTGGPITAANISVQLTPAQIAAGTSGEIAPPSSNQAGTFVGKPGDGTLAGAISGVKNQQTSFPNPADPTHQMQGTLSDYVQSVVSQLGIQSQTANTDVTNGKALVQQADTQRQSVSGVSIDQQVTDVIRYQQAYSASAKMVNTINQMLQTLMANV